MTLWATIRAGESDKARDSEASGDGRVRSEIGSATGQWARPVQSPSHILLISSSVLEREGLSLILERGGFVVRSAAPDIDAIIATSAPAPTVVLVEVPSEPEAFHQNWFNELRGVFPRSQLVLLAEKLNPDWLVLCRCVSLAGYLTKASPTPAILRQLRMIADGECILPMAMLREIARMDMRIKRPDRAHVAALTQRDIDILQHLVAGHPNKVIADRLHLAESTIKVGMKALFAKVGVTNRTQAAIWALNHGFEKNAGLGELLRAPTDTRNFR
jgi:two-component system nitrate/nitrite response regulator NarL